MASYEQGCAGWLWQQLTASAALTALVSTRIYEGQAPQNVVFPFVLFTFNSGHDVPTIGGASRIFTQPLYAVRGYVKDGSFLSADAIAGALDVVIQQGSPVGAVVAGNTWYCSGVREQGLRGIETVEGLQYRYAGGLYRMFVSF